MFTVGPDSLLLAQRLCIDDIAHTMLHAVDPLAPILATVRVRVRPISMLFIEPIIALILTAVLPHISPVSMHHAILERPLKVSTVGPLEASIATHLITGPLARVLAPISPKVDSFALFDACLEVSMIVAAITPHLDAFAILFVALSVLRVGLHRV